MKYFIYVNEKGVEGDSCIKAYTARCIMHLITINGHTLTETPEEADFMLVSLCDPEDVLHLEKVRKLHPQAKIIAGGHACVFYKLMAVHADYVNVGQGFEFFQCKTEKEFRELPCVYVPGKKEITPSSFIDWKKVPVAQTGEHRHYYLMGVGCKNKCGFCLTSWVNKHQLNSPIRAKKAVKALPPGGKMMFVSNEYTESAETSVKDIMLVDFLKQKFKDTNLARLGVEFATEATRKQYGKSFSDQQLLASLAHAKRLKMNLQLFCIAGLNTRDEWEGLFSKFPDDPDRSPKVWVKFTNLDLWMFCPVFKKRKEITPEMYLDKDFIQKLVKTYVVRNRRFRLYDIRHPASAFWRSSLGVVTNAEEYERVSKLKNCREIDKTYQLFQTLWDNDYSDEVNLWYKKK